MNLLIHVEFISAGLIEFLARPCFRNVADIAHIQCRLLWVPYIDCETIL